MASLAPADIEASREAIAVCAFSAWMADGCPPGRDAQYWLEVEAQLQAVRQAEITTVIAPAPRMQVRVSVSSGPRRPAGRQANSASALLPLVQSHRRPYAT